MKTKHTDGKWEIKYDKSFAGYIDCEYRKCCGGTFPIVSETPTEITVIGEVWPVEKKPSISQDETAKANAALICAAPELLNFTKQLLCAIIAQEKNGGKIERALLSAVSEVISKAEGK